MALNKPINVLEDHLNSGSILDPQDRVVSCHSSVPGNLVIVTERGQIICLTQDGQSTFRAKHVKVTW